MSLNLDQLRKKLNKIDSEIIELLAKRQALAPLVGKYKKAHGIAINQPGREKEILTTLKKQAKASHLSPELVEKLFKLIFKDSKRIQKNS